MKKIHFVVTSGGTKEPIDAVRYIGNRSTGRLGAAIATEAAARGHAVCLVHARESALPPRSATGPEDGAIRYAEFVTAEDLKERLHKEVSRLPDPGAVVMAAAVADFSPEPSEGKITSSQDELVLRLRKVAKIVDQVKTWKPTALLVKFKLESGCDREGLLTIGLASARQSQADLMLLNTSDAIGPERHQAILYRPDRATCIDLDTKPSIARAIVSAVEELLDERQGDS